MSSKPYLAVRQRAEGDPSFGEWFINDAVREFEEFSWARTKLEAGEQICSDMRENGRVEILAIVGNRPAGFIILCHEHDNHIGECLGVQFNYVLPEYRNLGIVRQFFRMAEAIARENGIPVMAWTHRTGVGQYTLRYRRINV